MYLPEVSIRRPVLTVMMTAALLIFGWIGLTRLPVREMPDIDFPVVSVTTLYAGASPEVVEEEVTDPLEEAINTVEGIKTLESSSFEGGSSITITFALERNVDVAAQEVREKVAAIRLQLPEEIEEPVVAKFDMDAQAIIWLAVTSVDRDQVDISDYAENVLKPYFEKLEGVGEVMLGGGQEFAVRLWLDPVKLAAREVTATDVVHALRTRNVEIPSGRIEGLDREFPVKTEGELTEVEAFNRLIVAFRNGAPVRIEDLGRAERGARNFRTTARFTELPDSLFRPAVGLGIVKQSEANTVSVAALVKEELARVRETLPSGYEVVIAYDSSIYVEQSIDELEEALLLGGALATGVIFLFLVSLRSTLIAALAIPTSIVATFAVIHFLGFTLNTFTMLALTISVGVVIDDAIVVLENIFRHMSQGKTRLQAAREGASEIAFAAMAATFSIAAVFFPVAFVEGMVGRMLYEFGFTVAVAVLISLFVALTLTPMLCSRFLEVPGKRRALSRWIEAAHGGMTSFYGILLKGAVKVRYIVLVLGVGVSLLSFQLFGMLGKEMVPAVDQSTLILFIRGPEGATLDFMDTYLREVEEVLTGYPEVRSYFTAIGLGDRGASHPTEAIAFLRLQPLEERREKGQCSQQELMADMRGRFADIPGFLVHVQERPVIASSDWGAPLQYVIMGPEVEDVYAVGEEFKQRLGEVPGIVDVFSELDINKPKLRIEVLRDEAADLGVSVADIAESMRLLLGGDHVSDFKRGGERYDVMVQMEEEARRVPGAIDSIYIRSSSGNLLSLASVVRVEETVGPSAIARWGLGRATTIQANLEGLPLASALEEAMSIADEILPDGFTTATAGQTEEMEESFASLSFALILAIVIIYMVLASQFNHFIHPFTIMIALPLSMVGALYSLYLFDLTINLFSIIGFIVLMGLVTKNSILLVDYTNQLREAGTARNEAVVEAGRVRLRPILMTAVSMIFGVLPAALGLGAGSESRRPMAVATAGGMAVSTLLTLFLVPVVYVVLDDVGALFKKVFRRGSPPAA